jgi:hypothetical protein
MMKSKLGRLSARLFSPLSWRTGTRRTFLLTLPISLPVWIVLCILMVVARGLAMLAQPIVYFWTAPPKRRKHGYYGVRPHRPAKSARIIKIHDREAA